MNFISRHVNALSDEDPKKRKAALLALYKIFVLSEVYIEKSKCLPYVANNRGTDADAAEHTEAAVYATAGQVAEK